MGIAALRIRGGYDATQVKHPVVAISDDTSSGIRDTCQLESGAYTDRRNEMRRAQSLANPSPIRACAVFAAVTLFSVSPAAAESSEGTKFGDAPLCEASAALIVDCPGSSGSCLLVGDNEKESSLFWFKLDDKPLHSAKQHEIKLKRHMIGDIEALAKLHDGPIVVFGSHSRNTSCVDIPERRTFGVIDHLTKESPIVKSIGPTPINCEALFGSYPPEESLINAACQAIKSAEDDANNARNDKPKCNEAKAYNAEGAVNVSKSKKPDIWIGLRAPLLPNHPIDKDRSNLAMLLHLQDLDHYRFDRVAVLDLGGRGIRELAYTDDGVVWVIAGPPHDLGKKESKKPWLKDQKAPFQLMRFQAAELNTNKIIVPEQLQELPPSSEGLAVYGETIFVLRDGDKPGEDKDQCAAHARYLKLPRTPANPR